MAEPGLERRLASLAEGLDALALLHRAERDGTLVDKEAIERSLAILRRDVEGCLAVFREITAIVREAEIWKRDVERAMQALARVVVS